MSAAMRLVGEQLDCTSGARKPGVPTPMEWEDPFVEMSLARGDSGLNVLLAGNFSDDFSEFEIRFH